MLSVIHAIAAKSCTFLIFRKDLEFNKNGGFILDHLSLILHIIVFLSTANSSFRTANFYSNMPYRTGS